MRCHRRRKWFLSFAAVGLLGVAAAGAAHAARPEPENGQSAKPLKQLSLEELSNIEVVTAGKRPEQIRRTPAAIHVLTQEDIRRSGATSIPQALRLVPGVEVARIDSSKWAIGVRGFGGRLARSMLVLMDGRSLYTPLFAGTYWEVQNTLLEDIERIEVIRGPGGTIWGANAVNGVINIITKSAKDTPGGLVALGGGNVDRGFLNFRYGGGNGGNLSYRAYGKAFARGPQVHSDSARFDDWAMGQGGFRVDWDRSARDTFTLLGDLYRGFMGQRLSITTVSPPALTTIERNSQLSGGNLIARWQRTLNPDSDFRLQVYYDRANRREANFAEARNTFDADFIHHFRYRQRHNLTWGLGARFSHGDTAAVVPTVVFIPSDFTDKLYSAFVQDEITLVENRFWLTLGSKFLHHSYSGYEYQPTARAMWMPRDRHSFWASFTRAVRTPSRVEQDLEITALLIPALPAFLRLMPNPDFSSEKVMSYEAGYRSLLTPRLSLDVAFFHNEYDDLLSVESETPFVEPAPPPPHLILPIFFRNQLRGATRGIEIAPTWRPWERTQFKAAYSFLNLDFRARPGSTDQSTANSIEGSSPRHRLILQTSFDLPRQMEVGLNFRYVTALPAQMVGSYSTADARWSWRPAEHWEFSVVGQNLLQPYHPEFSGNAGAVLGIRRAVYGKLTWTRQFP